jgi:hypothetical protein
MAIATTNVSVDMDLETKQEFIQDLIVECDKVLAENPENRCAKYCKEYLGSKEGQDLDAKGTLYGSSHTLQSKEFLIIHFSILQHRFF